MPDDLICPGFTKLDTVAYSGITYCTRLYLLQATATSSTNFSYHYGWISSIDAGLWHKL